MPQKSLPTQVLLAKEKIKGQWDDCGHIIGRLQWDTKKNVGGGGPWCVAAQSWAACFPRNPAHGYEQVLTEKNWNYKIADW